MNCSRQYQFCLKTMRAFAFAFVINNALIYYHAVGASSPELPQDEIPTFHNDEEDRATDYANYFSAYADLYHQKVMLTDHNRMKAYHSAIMGNKEIFDGKVVMDVGTGSSILAVWAAQAGAKRVYAVEYTGMADHAKRVVKANGVDHIVKVIHGAVEDVQLPLPNEEWDLFCEEDADVQECKGNQQVVDIIVSEWMGYFLLRESMLDSVIYARDKFLKPNTGMLFPSHATMLLAPIENEPHRKEIESEYSDAMTGWHEYLERAQQDYGVNMSCLEENFAKEQKEYYLMSGHWLQLDAAVALGSPTIVKTLDLATCTIEDARGVDSVPFEFSVTKTKTENSDEDKFVSGFAGWFDVDFRSRTDQAGEVNAPKIQNPAHLSTGPANGVTHWGQQVFYLPKAIPLRGDAAIQIKGSMEMIRAKENARMYTVHFRLNELAANPIDLVYQIV